MYIWGMDTHGHADWVGNGMILHLSITYRSIQVDVHLYGRHVVFRAKTELILWPRTSRWKLLQGKRVCTSDTPFNETLHSSLTQFNTALRDIKTLYYVL